MKIFYCSVNLRGLHLTVPHYAPVRRITPHETSHVTFLTLFTCTANQMQLHIPGLQSTERLQQYMYALHAAYPSHVEKLQSIVHWRHRRHLFGQGYAMGNHPQLRLVESAGGHSVAHDIRRGYHQRAEAGYRPPLLFLVDYATRHPTDGSDKEDERLRTQEVSQPKVGVLRQQPHQRIPVQSGAGVAQTALETVPVGHLPVTYIVVAVEQCPCRTDDATVMGCHHHRYSQPLTRLTHLRLMAMGVDHVGTQFLNQAVKIRIPTAAHLIECGSFIVLEFHSVVMIHERDNAHVRLPAYQLVDDVLHIHLTSAVGREEVARRHLQYLHKKNNFNGCE